MQKTIQAVPSIFYPESDGKPMAETEIHRDLMMDFIQMLKHYYRDREDVCISGNMFMYYEEGNATKSVAPDVFVAFGVAKKQRRTYLTWEEGRTPDFVLEIASPSTFNDDMRKKKQLYASVLEVEEYFIYDPLGEIVPSFIGFRLNDGVYEEINFKNERLPSTVLGLELGEREGILKLYNPTTSEWLQTLPERAETAEVRAETAEAKLERALEEIKLLREKH
ncbi:Uma2 family endonuclease [Candidatus Poribacteria bacterium]|nr:Uma2 family endonuclease [Candidatus Poribacteria bacterium]